MIINEFRGRFYFLSNFYNAPVTYNGLTYQNNEAAFQSVKLASKTDIDQKSRLSRKSFTTLPPNQAKRYGRKVTLRSDWETIKDDVMYQIVKAKFEQNPHLAKKLIETKDYTLVEGNTWNDKYWGVDLNSNKGHNKLGHILMRVRDELRQN